MTKSRPQFFLFLNAKIIILYLKIHTQYALVRYNLDKMEWQELIAVTLPLFSTIRYYHVLHVFRLCWQSALIAPTQRFKWLVAKLYELVVLSNCLTCTLELLRSCILLFIELFFNLQFTLNEFGQLCICITSSW